MINTSSRKKLTIIHMWSSYYSNIASYYGIKFGNVNKLVSNLGHESRYVHHYKNVQLCLWFGIKLVSMHRIAKLKQFDWLKIYIGFNKEKKKMLKKLWKILFELMNISVYGKTMANLRKRINVTLVNNAKDYKKYVSKPSFIS